MDDNINNSNRINNPNINNSQQNNQNELKKGFFKKVYYSIFKLEKYGELSAEGVRRAIGYLFKLSLIVALIIGISTIFRINELKQKGIDFLNEQVGEFTYSNGILNVQKEEPIRAPSKTVGEIIIDTKIETEEEVKQYINSFEENMGILVLKDKIIIKGIGENGSITYTYGNVLNDINVKELDKNKTIEFLNGSSIWGIYAIAFTVVLIYALINVFIQIIFNAVLLSIFGYLVSWLAKVRMRYAAIFNLAAYSLTLSVLLNAVYIVINMITGFTITYFQVMYIGVAVIYLIAAILLLKSEFLRIQAEVSKIVKISKQNEMEEENQENPEEKEKEEKKENPEKENPNNLDKPTQQEKKEKEGNQQNPQPQNIKELKNE
ncbi:MAG: DUF1189 domain-containing protein [Clostridia bacterium]|nr:DUF1189 domain-containing protein [Clostridia bacterium]